MTRREAGRTGPSQDPGANRVLAKGIALDLYREPFSTGLAQLDALAGLLARAAIEPEAVVLDGDMVLALARLAEAAHWRLERAA